jgi:hypothetical protein
VTAGSTRLELKAAFAATDLDRVRSWLLLLREGFRTTFPPRLVHSLYFDTFDLTSFRENLAGVSQRQKLRYRWYGDSPGPDAGALELKSKRNKVGRKETWRCAQAPWRDGDDWPTVVQALSRQLDERARALLAAWPQPVLLTRYRREYFESADRRLRATLDTGFCAFGQLHGRMPNLTRRIALPDVNVLEVKCAGSEQARAAALLGSCPVRLSRFSKYTVAAQNLVGVS